MLILAPYAPHLCEELWQRLGGKASLACEPWPQFDESLVKEDTVTLSVMFNGKARGTVKVSKGASQDEVRESCCSR